MADIAQMPGSKSEESKPITGNSPAAFKRRIERSKNRRRERLVEMRTNVDFRRAKPSEFDTDDNRQPLSIDWGMTKAKVAALFSQVPTVIVSALEDMFKPASHQFQKKLNQRLRKGGIEAVMFEVLPDVINKGGIGAAIMRYESKTEMRSMPVKPDEALSLQEKIGIRLGLMEREMEDQPFTTDRRFTCNRVSLDDLLIDEDFTGSDFNHSSWIGHSDKMTWTEAKSEFKLDDTQKDKACGDSRDGRDRTDKEIEEGASQEEDVVHYDEIFYWRHLYHEEEMYFTSIQRMVFVNGLGNEPVINEQWKGQQFSEELGTYIGACKFPIQVLTLNYLSDEAVPPSDSAIIRPQVLELMRSRMQMMLQRDHSRPVRWADINRLDADIMTLLMQGDYQHFIPVQGDGTKAVGEVARSGYPRDNHDFDRIIKNDMQEATGMGPNQMGTLATGERSASEAKITQGSFSTRQAQERARAVTFFLNIADVMAGLICLYDDFELEGFDKQSINHELAFSIRGDATVILDAEQRIERLMRFLNIAGKSGLVDPLPILQELASLHDIDPSCCQPPKDKGPEQPKVSMTFKGEDMANPLVLGTMAKLDMLPSEEDIVAGKMALAAAMGDEHELPGGPPGGGELPPEDIAMADDRPDWSSVDRINSRRDASQNGG